MLKSNPRTKQLPSISNHQNSIILPTVKNLSQENKNRHSASPFHLNKNYQSKISNTISSINNRNSTLHSHIYMSQIENSRLFSRSKNQLTTWSTMKMQQSMIKYQEKQTIFNRTMKQKKMQKKVYSVDVFKGEQQEFMKVFNTKNTKRQQIVQETYTDEFPLVCLQNVCYDSTFLFKRQGSCLALLNNRLYLFGGAIRRKYYHSENQGNINSQFLFHSYDEGGKWVREPISNQISLFKKNFICHTTTPLNKKYIVIIGGLVGDSQQTLTKFNRSILVYNTETKKMSEIPWNIGIRSHCCFSFQNFIVVHGGIDDYRSARSQMHIITLNCDKPNLTAKINTLQTNQNLAFHQMVTTLGEQRSFTINLRQNNGIYVFGGQNSEGQMTNQLKILKIYSSLQFDKKGIKKFQVLQTSGEPPCARKNHTMNLITSKSMLVIIGGEDSKSNILSDIWVMNLMYLKWSRIQTDPNIDMFFGGITRQASVSNNSSIFILGGHHLKDAGSSLLWRLDMCIPHEKKVPVKRNSDTISKMSSMWSIHYSNAQFQDDQIVDS